MATLMGDARNFVAQEPKAPTDNLPKLQVKVVNEKGQPISGAKIYASALSQDPRYRKLGKFDLLTDEDGQVSFSVYPKLRLMRIWASKDGFVPLFFNWENEETESIPASFKVVMQKGTRLGGVILDTNGKPIAGAKVDVSLVNGGVKIDPQKRVQLNTWLAEGVEAAISDQEGKWFIDNAPAGDDLELRLMFEHPKYINDKSRKPLTKFNVTLQQLRDETARFSLSRGLSIRGRITDDKGNVITKGIVVWGDRPLAEQGTQEVKLDKQGHYEISPQSPGKIRLTVVCPGWMPTDRVVELDEASGNATGVVEQNFSLQLGKRLRLKFVDPFGKPIPKVYVGIRAWHGQRALYNRKHPSLIESGIPVYADDDGNFAWDWAPNDLIQLQPAVSEWHFSKTIDVVATEQPQVITLTKPFAISGSVVNAKTGEPVNQFSIVPVAYGSASNTARGIAQRSWQKNFESKHFIFDNAFSSDDGRQMAFRFQAVGFRDLTTQRYRADSPALNTTIRLEPAPVRSVVIKEPDGTLSKSAKVWVAKPDQGTMVNRFEDYFDRYEKAYQVSEKGEVQYGAPEKQHAVVAVSDKGYAERYLEKNEVVRELRLQPWSRLEGVLVQAGKPVPHATVLVRPIRQLGGDHPHVQDIFQTTTNGEGEFVFERLPPVPSIVRSLLTPWQEFAITSSREVPVDLQPGEKHEVMLGGGGLQVIGKIRLIGEGAEKIQLRYGLNNLLRLAGGISTPKHARSPDPFASGEQKAWNQKLNSGLANDITREKFFVKIRDDSTFLISGVRHGQYRFLIKLYEPPTGCLIEPVGYGFLEFSTEDFQIQNNTLNLGTIDVKLKPIQKVGDSMPDFWFVNMDGQQQRISEFRGKYVLIDFWASWCAPCIKAFPDIAKFHEKTRKDDNISILSISVDKELMAAKTIALQQQIKWNVGFAESAGKGSSASALGVSTLPTYVVLDPKGRIIYRGFSHEQAFDVLTESVKGDKKTPKVLDEKLKPFEAYMKREMNHTERMISALEKIKTPEDAEMAAQLILKIVAERKKEREQEKTPDFEVLTKSELTALEEKYEARTVEIRKRMQAAFAVFDKPEYQKALGKIRDLAIW